MFALSLDENKRILCATYPEYQPLGVIVESFPQGDLSDYKYINGQYVYDPLPKPIKPKPQPTIEERLTDIELVLAEILGGALK